MTSILSFHHNIIFVTGIPDFFLTGLHAEPGANATSKELNALVEVYDKATMRFQTNNGVLLGDFNADCQYLSIARYSRLELVTDSRFSWLISEDSTTGSTVCAYDRLVQSRALIYSAAAYTDLAKSIRCASVYVPFEVHV